MASEASTSVPLKLPELFYRHQSRVVTGYHLLFIHSHALLAAANKNTLNIFLPAGPGLNELQDFKM